MTSPSSPLPSRRSRTGPAAPAPSREVARGAREVLLTPGPVSLDDEVLEALAQPVRVHYGDDWARLLARVRAGLAAIFRTQGRVFLLYGPGTAALEMAIGSVLAPGDELLVPVNGRFAERIAEVASRLRLEVRTTTTPAGRPLDPQALADALRRYKRTRAVALVHHETMLGLVNPLEELCAAAREREALVVVDAVSSLGGVDLRMDAWGIDLCVSVANKCLAAPIGVAPLAASPRAWRAVTDGRRKSAGWYLNLETWHREEELRPWHPHPTTMPTSIVEALDVAVSRILALGLDAWQARHAAAARRVRDGLRALGFELLVDDAAASPVTTAVLVLPRMDVDRYIAWLRSAHGLRVAPGLGDLAGKIFRVGHMGRAAEPGIVDAYLAATAEYVEEQGLG